MALVLVATKTHTNFDNNCEKCGIHCWVKDIGRGKLLECVNNKAFALPGKDLQRLERGEFVTGQHLVFMGMGHRSDPSFNGVDIC